MYCKQCGKEIAADSVFCSYCGAEQPVTPIESAIPPEDATREFVPPEVKPEPPEPYVESFRSKVVGKLIFFAIVALLVFVFYYMGQHATPESWRGYTEIIRPFFA